MDGSTCMELALEGERLCKAGDCRAGVAFFEAAIQVRAHSGSIQVCRAPHSGLASGAEAKISRRQTPARAHSGALIAIPGLKKNFTYDCLTVCF